MNILIADSGSTKTAWILLSEGAEPKEYVTSGINPNFNTVDEMADIIRDGLMDVINGASIGFVYFYGTGCGPESRKKKVKAALQLCFFDALIEVNTDLLAAARACLGNEAGVACILGTGSNTCLYDGEKIIKGVPSMGFALADEGSGGYFGKKILNSYFYELMPEELRNWLDENFDMRLESVLDAVYIKPRPNKYVAGFTRLIGEFHEHEFVRAMVRDGFIEFVEKQVGYLGDLTGQKVGFVGTIASIDRDILEEVLQQKGMILGDIVRGPIDELADYHLKLIYK